MSFLQELHDARRARLRKWASRAVPDYGITMRNGRPLPPRASEPEFEPEPLPGPTADCANCAAPPATDAQVLSETNVNLDEGRIEPQGDMRRILMCDIVQAVAQYYGVTQSQLRSRSRLWKFVKPRHVAMYLSRELTKQSFPKIASLFGGRDHTTAIHGHRRITKLIQENASLAGDIDTLKQKLGCRS